MCTWLNSKCSSLAKLIRRKQLDDDDSSAWQRFDKVLQQRALFFHIMSQLNFLPRFLFAEAVFEEHMQEVCTGYDKDTPVCDFDGRVAKIMPLVLTARIILTILGVVLMFAPCWKLSLSKVILYYWFLFAMIQINYPFIFGNFYSPTLSQALIV